MLPRHIREKPTSTTPIDLYNNFSRWVKRTLHKRSDPQPVTRRTQNTLRSIPRGFRLATAGFSGLAIGTTASNMSSSSNSNGQTDWKSLSDSEWKQRLTPEQFRILRLKDTEYPGTGEYNKTKDSGVYACAGCNTPLYTSDHKFESSCGWPAYFDAIPGRVKEIADADGHRIEIVCQTCGGHLGHVFKGEGYNTPTDARHCVNSKSLKFNKQANPKEQDSRY